jgi:hypothetical protein
MKKIFIATFLLAIALVVYYRPLLFAQLLPVKTLEVKVVCLNTPGQQLTQEQANTYLAGSHIIGQAFDTQHYRQCYILIKKRPGAPRGEITEAVDNIYAAVIGTGGL